MSSEALTSISLTSLPRLSQGKVRYIICASEPAPSTMFSLVRIRRTCQETPPLNLSPLHYELQAMLTSKCGRDLFSLPDNRTLLFVTSGMSSSRTNSRVFSQVINLTVPRSYKRIRRHSQGQPFFTAQSSSLSQCRELAFVRNSWK